MPKLDIESITRDVPTTSKSTVAQQPITSTQPTSTAVNKPGKATLSIYDMITKEVSQEKEQIGVTLKKDLVDKLKTVVIDSNTNMSKLFEEILTPLLEDVKIKTKNVEMYNEKNKLKGRRRKDK